MIHKSEYELLREQNIRKNFEILRGLGLQLEYPPKPPTLSEEQIDAIVEKRQKIAAGVAKRKKSVNKVKSELNSDSGECRRSGRLLGKKPTNYNEILVVGDYSDVKPKIQISLASSSNKLDPSTYVYQKPTEKRENVYGHIEGVPIGTVFQSRMECNYAGVHRPTVAGIHGGPEGAYSVVLSGGYEDDVDMGDKFTYTGAGGRDLRGTAQNPKNLRTAVQSKDQTLTGTNEALAKSQTTRNPVRVVRGFNLGNEFAPKKGYRYDGLYTVDKYWSAMGLSGFKVFRFALIRCSDQPPPPWEQDNLENVLEEENLSEEKEDGSSPISVEEPVKKRGRSEKIQEA